MLQPLLLLIVLIFLNATFASAEIAVISTNAGLSVLFANLFTDGKIAPAFFNCKGLALAIVLWVFTNLIKKTKNWHPIIFIGLSAIVGIVFSM